MKNKVVIGAITYLFILLFAYAATVKLADFQKFSVQLGQSPLVTDFAGWMVRVVPAIEYLVAGLLAFRKTRLIGLYAAFTLMCLFTEYIIVILKFSPYVPCSCGGIVENFSWSEHLVFNIGFVLLALTGVLLHKTKIDANMAFITKPQPIKI